MMVCWLFFPIILNWKGSHFSSIKIFEDADVDVIGDCFVIFIFGLDFSGPYKLTAFDKNGLKVELTCERDNGQANVTIINVKSTNSTATTMSDYIFQAAVPKVTK